MRGGGENTWDEGGLLQWWGLKAGARTTDRGSSFHAGLLRLLLGRAPPPPPLRLPAASHAGTPCRSRTVGEGLPVQEPVGEEKCVCVCVCSAPIRPFLTISDATRTGGVPLAALQYVRH